MVTYVFDMLFFSNAELYLLQEVFLNVAAVTWNSLCDVPKQPYEVREGFVEIMWLTMGFPGPPRRCWSHVNAMGQFHNKAEFG